MALGRSKDSLKGFASGLRKSTKGVKLPVQKLQVVHNQAAVIQRRLRSKTSASGAATVQSNPSLTRKNVSNNLDAKIKKARGGVPPLGTAKAAQKQGQTASRNARAASTKRFLKDSTRASRKDTAARNISKSARRAVGLAGAALGATEGIKFVKREIEKDKARKSKKKATKKKSK
jgi:hypothetical protein